jgi:hypothetical protein
VFGSLGGALSSLKLYIMPNWVSAAWRKQKGPSHWPSVWKSKPRYSRWSAATRKRAALVVASAALRPPAVVAAICIWYIREETTGENHEGRDGDNDGRSEASLTVVHKGQINTAI